MGHGCGVSQFPQFYDKIKNEYKFLPHPYVRNYLGEKRHKYLQETWIPESAKSVETFVMVSINDMRTIKYWQNLKKIMDTERDKITKQCRSVMHVLCHWGLLEGIYLQ